MAENGMRVGPGPTATAAAAAAANAVASAGPTAGPGTGTNNTSNGEHENEHTGNSDGEKAQPAPAIQKYVQELMTERSRMENHFPLAVKLIDEALERVQLNGRIPTRDQYADVYQQRTIKLSQKVHVPIKDKKFNYVGKLLGPKGNSLRRLQEETQCKIVILGRFSMKDRAREEELRNSADAKYAHLNLPLHVEVSTIAAPAEAYARVAYALAEIRRYLIPDKHDDIRQEQYRELMEDPEAAKKLTLRQLQQQSGGGGGVGGSGGGGGGGGGGNGGNVAAAANPGAGGNGNQRAGGNYRQKFQQQSHYHHNDETVYYRSHNNYHHQPKPYVPAAQRGNAMHTTLPPQAIVRASPPGMVVSAASFNGRNAAGMGNAGGGIMTANSIVAATGGGGLGGGQVPPNMRYRPAAPYQFVKK